MVLTAWSGTLLFKEIDPFFAIYSLGSEVRPWMAYASLALLLSAAVFLPGDPRFAPAQEQTDREQTG